MNPLIHTSSSNVALHTYESALENPAMNYLLSLSSAQSRVTMQSFLGRVAMMVQKVTFEQFEWGSLRRPHVMAILTMLNNAQLAPATINTYLAALKGVAREAWALKQMDAEAYAQIKDIRRNRGVRLAAGRRLQVEELYELYKACSSVPGDLIGSRDLAIISLLAGCGLRRSELVSLDVENLRSQDQSIVLIGKGNKQREAFVPQSSWSKLEGWLQLSGITSGAIFVRVRRENKITDSRLTSQAVLHVLGQRQVQAGLEPLTPHDLRRTYATLLLENGEDIATVMDAMGHADVSTTRRYDMRNSDHVKAARDRLKI